MIAKQYWNGDVGLRLTPQEAIGVASLLGRLTGPITIELGLPPDAYDRLADCLEYGDHPAYPFGEPPTIVSGGIYRHLVPLEIKLEEGGDES